MKELFSLSQLLQTKSDKMRFNGWPNKIVIGSYKGILEHNILLIVETDDKLLAARNMTFNDGQESILIVNEDRKAYLEYADGNQVYVGLFKEVNALDIKTLENWTLDGNTYYSTN